MKIIFETPRLILREHELSDAQFMFDLNQDPEVTRYTGNEAFSNLDEAVEVVHYVRRQYQDFGIGRWVVVSKETGESLGWSGLKNDTELGIIDLGYRFFRRFWGQGYATESALASVEYGFKTLGLPLITGKADKENNASIRVLEKIGMHYVKDFLEDGALLSWYEIENA